MACCLMAPNHYLIQCWLQGWGVYRTTEYEYSKISTWVHVFSVVMFIILGKMSTRVVLASDLVDCDIWFIYTGQQSLAQLGRRWISLVLYMSRPWLRRGCSHHWTEQLEGYCSGTCYEGPDFVCQLEGKRQSHKKKMKRCGCIFIRLQSWMSVC